MMDTSLISEFAKEAVTIGQIAEVGKGLGRNFGKQLAHHAQVPLRAMSGENLLRTGMHALNQRGTTEKALHLGMTGWGVGQDLKDRETVTGRERGLGERVGRAAGRVLTGVAGMGAAEVSRREHVQHRLGLGGRSHASPTGLVARIGGGAGALVGQGIADSAGASVGGTLGRAVDSTASLLRGKKKRKDEVK